MLFIGNVDKKCLHTISQHHENKKGSITFTFSIFLNEEL